MCPQSLLLFKAIELYITQAYKAAHTLAHTNETTQPHIVNKNFTKVKRVLEQPICMAKLLTIM